MHCRTCIRTYLPNETYSGLVVWYLDHRFPALTAINSHTELIPEFGVRWTLV